MPLLPMFPLGSVLFPAMPLALRVFEERYLKMMGAVLDNQPSEFGVVLIERGLEVGGGDQRFDIGATARVLQIEAPDGPLEVVARGERRFRVIQWVSDEPYPQADIEYLEDFESAKVDTTSLDLAESTVRGALEYLATLDLSIPWPTDIELSEDPIEKAWQLAGISPLGTLDHQDLLAAPEVSWLLSHTIETVSEALITFRAANDFPDDQT